MYKLTSNLRKSCEIINYLFNRPNFFERLCEYSNNDISKVTKNISLIINYYLTTNDSNINYDLKVLFERIKEIALFKRDFLIHPSNSVNKRFYTFFGIDQFSSLKERENNELEMLEALVAFYPHNKDGSSNEIYESVEEALIKSFSSPEIVYKSILKQPFQKEEPVLVGTSEISYYERILKKRLENVEEQLRKTGAKIGKKVINTYIGKDAMLVLFPRKIGQQEISELDIKNRATLRTIPPYYLSFILIPSYYKLLEICNANKKLESNTMISIRDGKPPNLDIGVINRYSNFSYSRIEPVCITEQFTYTNDEFTQDVNYDIDLIYGKYDSNKSRNAATRSWSTDMEQIRIKNNIEVRLRNGKYEIRNGRHRIIYIKQYYVENYEFYKEINQLDTLKKQTTLPMRVERTIEDKTMIEDLLYLEGKDNSFRSLKIDTSNDYPELILIYKNKIYKITNKEELRRLVEYIKRNIYENEFYLGENNEEDKLDYRKMITDIILSVRDKIYQMNLLDIYLFIKKSNYLSNGENLNIGSLYREYLDIRTKIELSEVNNKPLDLVGEIETKIKQEEVGNYIMEIILENPDYVFLSWEGLIDILRLYPKLQPYTDEFLKKAANNEGYQRLKIEKLYGNNSYTKKTKLW